MPAVCFYLTQLPTLQEHGSAHPFSVNLWPVTQSSPAPMAHPATEEQDTQRHEVHHARRGRLTVSGDFFLEPFCSHTDEPRPLICARDDLPAVIVIWQGASSCLPHITGNGYHTFYFIPAMPSPGLGISAMATGASLLVGERLSTWGNRGRAVGWYTGWEADMGT